MPCDKAALKDWTKRFIQSRNSILNDVKSVLEDVENFDIIVDTGSKVQKYIVLPDLSKINDHIKGAGSDTIYIVTYNKRANLDFVLSNWKMLSAFKGLCVVFCNPIAGGDQKWSVYPSTHSIFAEPKTLKKGLETLFLSVEEV